MIDNPTLVQFCNGVLRPAADTLARGAYQAAAIVQQANVPIAALEGQTIKELLAKQAGDVVADGSDRDGRRPITGADAALLIALLELVDYWFTHPEPNTQSVPIRATLAVAVNPS